MTVVVGEKFIVVVAINKIKSKCYKYKDLYFIRLKKNQNQNEQYDLYMQTLIFV